MSSDRAKAASQARTLLFLFGALSLLAVCAGAWVANANGVGAGSWGRNVAAWVVGAMAAATLAATMRPAVLIAAVCVAPIGLMASFLSADQSGVHRWIDLGALHVNVAMLSLPTSIVATAILSSQRAWPIAVLGLSLALLVVQPDASQALTLSAAAVLIAGVSLRGVRRAAVIVFAVALGAAAWLRPDPLQPVPEVEEMVELAFSLSVVAGAVIVALLVAVAASPLIATWTGTRSGSRAGMALAVCLMMWTIAPAMGAFPVPFAGIGMSPIVGAWLGVGLLAGWIRRNRIKGERNE